MGHFDDVIGNGDYGYGQTAAQNLAINSPSYAQKNSDNYEYYEEDPNYWTNL